MIIRAILMGIGGFGLPYAIGTELSGILYVMAFMLVTYHCGMDAGYRIAVRQLSESGGSEGADSE